MSVPEPIVTRPLAGHSVAVPDFVATRAADRGISVRAWLLTALLLLAPLVAYWPATFHDYGLRDDYSNLREAHEEPGKVVRFCASHARPIYGWLLQSTYGLTNSVQGLAWLRCVSAMLLGAISLVMFRGLRGLGWSFGSSLSAAMLIALVPSSQVIAAWAVGWPYAITALLAVAAFFTAEGALPVGRGASTGRIVGQWAIALGLLLVGALVYQSSVLFYLVPLAGALIAQRQRHRSLVRAARWLGLHLGLVVTALGLAYCTITALYSAGVFVKSARIAFEHHWVDKAAWFLREPLPNALSLFVLNDDNHRDHALYVACAAAVALVLAAGVYVEWRRHGRARGLIWLAGLCALPVFAFAISLVASERYATYRTILAMTAVLVCFLVASVRALTEHWGATARGLLAALILSTAFLTAQHHAYALIAVPQGNEWQLIVAGAKHVRLDAQRRPRIFAIASTPADISTASIYHDEFGSLSSNSEWVPKEMFKRAMHDLHPDIPEIDTRYEFSTGPKLPADQRFDVIIDMHRLRHFYSDN